MERKEIELGAMVYWWRHGGGAFAKSGHFNWKHYCKVIDAKNEIIRNSILGEDVRKEQTNQNTDNDNRNEQERSR